MSNAFFVTRLGQVRNVHTLIEQESLEHNVLVIMFTSGDQSLRSNIRSACREELFEDILYLKLPRFPLRQSRKKNEKIYTRMENVLESLNDTFSVRELYVCNIDNYYVYLERIIADRGYPMVINLFEEGLTTYKITSGESLERAENAPNRNDVRKAWNEFRKALKKFILDTAVLVLQCLAFVVRKPLLTYAHNLWIRLTVEKNHRYGVIHDFNKVYVCFPEMVNSKALHFASAEKLRFKFNQIEDEALKEEIAGFSVIFVNQKYVNYTSHFRILFQIFDEMGIDRVMIKLHPKEDSEFVEEKIRENQAGYENIEVKILSSIGQIPVEDLVYSCGIRKVIGLTTSALIYLRDCPQPVEVISIADRYRQLCAGEDSGVASRELVQFDDEYRFFRRFENIPQFEPGDHPADTGEMRKRGVQP